MSQISFFAFLFLFTFSFSSGMGADGTGVLAGTSSTSEDPGVEAASVSLPRRPLHIVYLEDQEIIALMAKRQFEKLRDSCTSHEIQFTHFPDGDALTLPFIEELLRGGKTIVGLFDIDMPREHGDVALARIREGLEEKGLVLPPCVAVTSNEDYYNIEHAQSKGFVFGTGKISGGVDGLIKILHRAHPKEFGPNPIKCELARARRRIDPEAREGRRAARARGDTSESQTTISLASPPHSSVSGFSASPPSAAAAASYEAEPKSSPPPRSHNVKSFLRSLEENQKLTVVTTGEGIIDFEASGTPGPIPGSIVDRTPSAACKGIVREEDEEAKSSKSPAHAKDVESKVKRYPSHEEEDEEEAQGDEVRGGEVKTSFPTHHGGKIPTSVSPELGDMASGALKTEATKSPHHEASPPPAAANSEALSAEGRRFAIERHDTKITPPWPVPQVEDVPHGVGVPPVRPRSIRNLWGCLPW